MTKQTKVSKPKSLNFLRWILYRLSSEWILESWRVPNGGAVVFLRSVIGAIYLFVLALGVLNIVDPERTGRFSFEQLRVQVVQYLPWFGVFFAGIYTALYTRFASQWTYLANLYNQIKGAEVAGASNEEALAQWKAGFIEDAINLHLDCKGSIVAIIDAWLKDQKVAKEFVDKTVAGRERLDDLQSRLAVSKSFARKKFGGDMKPVDINEPSADQRKEKKVV